MANTIARGGTELIAARVENALKDNPNRNEVDIWHSRFNGNVELDRKRILVCHDLPQDPMYDHLSNSGWQFFDHFVFVSHWQQSMFNMFRGIPYARGTVVENSIEPIPDHTKPPLGPMNIIYTSTPHRGLDILTAAFEMLQEHYDIRLKVFSSFDLYGWGNRDQHFQTLFGRLENNSKVTYSKSVPNETIRKELESAHIFALPSVWTETSCLALIEAMSAECACIHSSLGALPETSKGLTHMYQHTENKREHLERFVTELELVIQSYNPNIIDTKAIDYDHNIDRFNAKWNSLINEVVNGS